MINNWTIPRNLAIIQQQSTNAICLVSWEQQQQQHISFDKLQSYQIHMQGSIICTRNDKLHWQFQQMSWYHVQLWIFMRSHICVSLPEEKRSRENETSKRLLCQFSTRKTFNFRFSLHIHYTSHWVSWTAW